jgi:hypothetical protein
VRKLFLLPVTCFLFNPNLCLLAQDKSKSDADKPRVFITDSQSWDMAAYGGGGPGGGGSMARGGARPQTAEIIKTFGERCPQVVTNNIQSKADYIVILDHEGGKSFVRHKNKVAVFTRVTGDSLVSKSTVSLGGSVQDACDAITKDWPEHGPALRSAAAAAATPAPVPAPPPAAAASAPPVVTPAVLRDPPAQTGAAAAAPAATPASAKLSIASTPDAADIELDGSFVGNSPSELQVAEGDHTITVKKSGFKDWQRTMKISGGSSIHLSAELEKLPAQ